MLALILVMMLPAASAFAEDTEGISVNAGVGTVTDLNDGDGIAPDPDALFDVGFSLVFTNGNTLNGPSRQLKQGQTLESVDANGIVEGDLFRGVIFSVTPPDGYTLDAASSTPVNTEIPLIAGQDINALFNFTFGEASASTMQITNLAMTRTGENQIVLSFDANAYGHLYFDLYDQGDYTYQLDSDFTAGSNSFSYVVPQDKMAAQVEIYFTMSGDMTGDQEVGPTMYDVPPWNSPAAQITNVVVTRISESEFTVALDSTFDGVIYWGPGFDGDTDGNLDDVWASAVTIGHNIWTLDVFYDIHETTSLAISVWPYDADEAAFTEAYLIPPVQVKTGWEKQANGTWKYLTNGAAATGWKKVGSAWYYLNASGIMQTGWTKVGSSWYYLTGSGAMKTGWLKSGSKWYYLTSSGAMKTGWLKSGSTWYYLGGASDGAMKTGWQKIGSKRYYFNASGVWIK
jgi:hypothetical protein